MKTLMALGILGALALQDKVDLKVGDAAPAFEAKDDAGKDWKSADHVGKKIIVVVLDNRGFGCIHRLQRGSGGARLNNMLDDCVPEGGSRSTIDFAAHAASMGAGAVHVNSLAELKQAMRRARAATTTQVIVIDTTAERTTDDGGCWWEVAIPEVSERAEVNEAHARYLDSQQTQRR